MARKNWIEQPEPEEGLVFGVNIDWEIVSAQGSLDSVMEAEDCRCVGTEQECLDFVEEHKPKEDKNQLTPAQCTCGKSKQADGTCDGSHEEKTTNQTGTTPVTLEELQGREKDALKDMAGLIAKEKDIKKPHHGSGVKKLAQWIIDNR